jgi:hypothetical protein
MDKLSAAYQAAEFRLQYARCTTTTSDPSSFHGGCSPLEADQELALNGLVTAACPCWRWGEELLQWRSRCCLLASYGCAAVRL